MSPDNAKIRIRQIQYDMSLARKKGIDTDGDDYAPLRGEILKLRGILKQSSAAKPKSLADMSMDEYAAHRKSGRS